MLGVHDLLLFVLSGLLLNMTPGPDTAYIVGRGLQRGWRGGAAAALGVGCGCLVHVLAAAIGLSALLVASSAAFAVIKLVGAAYLIFIGVQMAFSRRRLVAASEQGGDVAALRQIFWQGALTNALNPKVALFFLALLPQFVDADAPHQGMAFLALGLLFDINGTLWNLGIAAFAAKAATRFRRSSGARVWINRLLGSFFVALGIRVALLQAR